MSGLFGGGQVQSSTPVISSMQIQTSCYGRPVPWVFGQQRVAPNLIHYDDFTAIPHTHSQSGGKGGGGNDTTDYSYSVALLLALGSGEIASIGRTWKDKKQSTLADLKLDFYDGSATQSSYPYFVTKHPEKALPYRGLAYVASGAYDLGTSATLGNHTFEVQAPGSISSKFQGSEVHDADIVDVITAILTDTNQGIGLPPESVGDLEQFRTYCLANSLWVSPAYNEQRGAFDYIRNLLTIGFADAVYSGGVFKIVPYSDVPATSTLATYDPVLTPLELTEDDFLTGGGEIIKISQKPSDEAYNKVQVKFADRANDYNDNIATASDDADIELHGLRAKDVVELHEIADAAVAQKVADFILARSLYVLNTYEFRLSWKHARIEPMDVLLLTYVPKYLDQTPVLVVEVNESEDGVLSILAEDYPMGANRSSTKPVPGTGSSNINYAVQPGDANAPVMFEPPARLTNNTPQIWLATSGGQNWGGCVVWASTDDTTYQKIGSVKGSAVHGVLSAGLEVGAAHDATNALSVDLSVSKGVLKHGTSQAAQDLLTACYVDGEYIAYSNETLTGANAYRLTGLERGAYGVDIAAHASGGKFVFLDASVFKYNYPREWSGKTIWIKLASYNQFGNSVQDLSKVTAYQHTINGAPVTVATTLRTSPLVFGIRVDWTLPPGSADYLQATELWYSASQSRANASLLVSLASPQASHTLTGLKAGQILYFWIRFIDKLGNVGNFYPTGNGVMGQSSIDADQILDYLAGQIGKTQLAIDLLTPIEKIKQIDLLQKQVFDIQSTVFEIPAGADLREMIAQQADLASKSDALAATQLVALASADKSLSAARTQLISRLADAKSSIVDLQVSLVDKTQALSRNITTVQSQFAGNLALVQSAQNTLTTKTNAMATKIDTVEATVGQNSAAIQIEATARASADAAQAQTVITLQASVNNSLAIIQTAQTTQTTATTALSTRIDTLQASVGANSALIQNEQTARVNSEASIAQSITTLQTAYGSVSSAIQSEATTRSDAIGAVSRRVDTIESTANGASSSVQTMSTAVSTISGSLSAMHTIKTQVSAGGHTYLAGIGVGVSNETGVIESQILLSANRVAIIDESSGTLSVPFVVQGGQVFIRDTFIGNATITSAKIANLSVQSAHIQDLTVGENKITGNSVTEADDFMSGASDGTSFVVTATSKVMIIASYLANYIGNSDRGHFGFGVRGQFVTDVAVSYYTSGGASTVSISGTLGPGTYQLQVSGGQLTDATILRCFILKVKK
ncbi:phage tail tip fiber protein [Undibacterium sp. Di26W]|uniref:phage tail protein n=1 Tax=Undibacterium sp. Di26W TaxID=3413035 RepID=UPI003BF0BDC0